MNINPSSSPLLEANPPGLPNGSGRGARPEETTIEELLGRIEALPPGAARDLVSECLQSVLALHGDGLARMLKIIRNAGEKGREIEGAIVRDKVACGLLLIHGLHPVPLQDRLLAALEKVRPYMKSHGGNVELLTLENEVAILRLEGSCQSCPSSSVTLELAVRQAIEEACPDLLGYTVEGAIAQAATTTHLPAGAPTWTVIDGFGGLQEGEMRALELSAVPIIVLRTQAGLYAYRNHCPVCQTSLDAGRLDAGLLCCREGHRFEVQRAGRCPDNDSVHLDPFPLLAANGTVKISVR